MFLFWSQLAISIRVYLLLPKICYLALEQSCFENTAFGCLWDVSCIHAWRKDLWPQYLMFSIRFCCYPYTISKSLHCLHLNSKMTDIFVNYDNSDQKVLTSGLADVAMDQS